MNEVDHFVHQPGGALRRFVREIIWVRSDQPRSQILLPETTLTLAMRQSGSALLEETLLPSALVSGLQQRSRVVQHTAGSSVVIVRFTETGGAAMVQDRVDLLYNQTVPLDAVLPQRKIDNVQNVLADTPDIPRQILAMEEFLMGEIYRQNASARAKDATQIEAAAKLIRDSQGTLSIASVARRVAMSHSALERQFRAVVGTTPKMLSRLARLQNVCRLRDSGRTFTEIAFEAGYSDQPHFVHDFRLFTGVSPETFFYHASPRNLPTFYK
jgi:AraC-like DNA-binding protein